MIISWFKEHWYAVVGLVLYVGFLLLQRVLRARKLKALDERFSKMGSRAGLVGGLDFELPPIVTLRVECRCGMSAMCGKKDAIVATGWAAPKKTGPDNRWMCPACAGGGSDG